MNNKIIRAGIIGCGLIGNKRAAVIENDPISVLRAASDINVGIAETLLKQSADGAVGRVFQDWRDMLDKEKLDAVIVATPNKYLEEISLRALQQRINVLCEKPLGRNHRESARMVEVARANGVVLKTGFNHRHHPAIFKAHNLISEGVIGQVYYTRCIYGHGGRPGYEREWRASRDVCGGGELLDQGVHVVDLFRWFLGDFEEAVGYTQTCYWPMEVEDNAFAIFRTSRGQTAMMHTSWTQWKNRFTFEIFGEAGYLIIDGLGGSYGKEILTIGKRPANKDNAQVYLGGVPQEETLVFDGPDPSWRMEWEEFKAAIREGREPLGNGCDGLEANRMLAAIYLSAKEKRPVKINEVDS